MPSYTMRILWVVASVGALTNAHTSALGLNSRERPASWNDSVAANIACEILDVSLPGLVAFPGSTQYDDDIAHWASSSQENSTCTVEPASIDDVSTIIQVIGDPSIRSPFAVKSGGHAYNLNHSSTLGVQIAMSQFSNITYNEGDGTVTLGVGLTWDQVYEELEPLEIMVAGGRINGVGVGGLSTGGGYSWKTNQYGLTIDTMVSLELVLPSGEQLNVTNASNPDLFFALRGGLNNFGIVTSVTLEAHPQTLVYGGSIEYLATDDNVAAFSQAVINFSTNNTDPKAQIIPTYASSEGQGVLLLDMFYDGPTPPVGLYDAFLAIPSFLTDVSTRSFVDFMDVMGNGDALPGPEGVAQTTIPMTGYPIKVLDEIWEQVASFGTRLQANSPNASVLITASPEPFLSAFSHSRGGAYPHSPDRPVTPSSIAFTYQTPNGTVPLAEQIATEATYISELKNFTSLVKSRAIDEGVTLPNDTLYPNYAEADTPLELLYGDNLPRLKQIAAKYDPERVMSLTGGFKIA